MNDLRINTEIEKLKKVAKGYLVRQKYNKAIAALTAASDLAYNYNQVYVDIDMENLVGELATELLNNKLIKVTKQKKDNLADFLPAKTVLFYDGIGFDARGIVTNHLKGLGEAGIKVVYVTLEHRPQEQVIVDGILKEYNIEKRYFDNSNYLKAVQDLNAIFEDVKPDMAFFYTLPYDVAGSVLFRAYEGRMVRVLSDLTDHAFWLGRDSIDYVWSLRDIGACIAAYERNIPVDRILCSYLSAEVNESISFKGWPCDTTNKKVIFSGGSLYKTLGDENLYYYQIVSHILSSHDDTVFVYCGAGDSSEIDKLKKEYPDRIYLLPERDDFYQMIENCTLYLNTYPMFGGMMTRYAILAGKVPVTLKHECDSDGLVPNQDELQIEYEDINTLLQDVDRMLVEESYLSEREKLLEKGKYTTEDFNKVTKDIIERLETDYSFKIEKPDTEKFRSEYINRFIMREQLSNVICLDGRRRFLAWRYPGTFIYYLYKKISARK